MIIDTIIALIFLSSFQSTITVPNDFPTIQQALNAAINEDHIIVKPGTYKENIDFKGKVVILRSEQGPSLTVIDGNQSGSVVTCKSKEGPGTVLHGFTLTNGSGTWIPPVSFYYGGGMYNHNSSPTVIGCVFSNNIVKNPVTGGFGGGMHNFQSHPTISHCQFNNNEADFGGGVSNHKSDPKFSHCTFNVKAGFLSDGGGMYNNESNPLVQDCVFTPGSSTYLVEGGGMYNTFSRPKVINCLFYDFKSCANGGGMHNYYSNPELIRCLFQSNESFNYMGGIGGDGGGIYNSHSNPSIKECGFIDNRSDLHGGAISNYLSTGVLENCTFTGNASAQGGAIHGDGGKAVNSIFWNNQAPLGPEIFGNWVVSYSDIQGGYPGIGNIDADPLFADGANGDIHLTHPSPCKDAGDNTGVTETVDFEGDPRIKYGIVDMGADEFSPHLYVTGDKAPGGQVIGKIVGLPGTSPLAIFAGAQGLSNPIPTIWGSFWIDLSASWVLLQPLGVLPSKGILELPATLPLGAYDLYLQAMVGLNPDSLSNLEPLFIQ